jgi:hypothetical protein
MLADLVAVILGHAPRPLTKPQVRRRDPDLLRDERDSLVRQLRAARREPPMRVLNFRIKAKPSLVGPRLPATMSRSSSSRVQCSTSSSRSTRTTTLSRDPPLTIARGADKRSGNGRERTFRTWYTRCRRRLPAAPTSDCRSQGGTSPRGKRLAYPDGVRCGR